jgi:hypothetical protein
MPRITMRKVEIPIDRLASGSEVNEWLRCANCNGVEFSLNRRVGVEGIFFGCTDCGANFWTKDFKSFYEGPDKPVCYRALDD